MLPGDPRTIIDVLDGSALARRLLENKIVDVTVAVRRLERNAFAGVEVHDLAERLRLAWSP